MSIEDLIGKTLLSVEEVDNDEVHLNFSDGSSYKMWHRQDCCESVYLADVCGEWADLIGSPLLMAEVASEDGSDDDDCSESRTWTFYKFGTVKGYVTLRWCGESNGYYSESVDLDCTCEAAS